MRKALYREGYDSVERIEGPLLFLRNVENAGFGELVEIETDEGALAGQILQTDEDSCIVQVFGSTMGIRRKAATVWLERDVLKLPVGPGMLGNVFDGRGRRQDGKGVGFAEEWLSVEGLPINPHRRQGPDNYVETGISTIDMMNTLVRGQKLPLFSGAGLPANEIAARITSEAQVPGRDTPFLVVFAAIGITRREARFYLDHFSETGALANGIFFVNLAADSAVERLLTPRMALTAAEYFAFTKGYDVLVVLTDMLHYCDALREVSASREEIPGRRGFPGYMYSDLASLYERAGCIRGSKGSVTQIPIITMPDDDMTHPVVDLTGYITEGQIVLDRNLHERGVLPPVNVLPSLSRLMNKGIGKSKTFPEHRAVADQLYAAYARARELERLKLIVGDDGLSAVEHRYLEFGRLFNDLFVDQKESGRTLQESLRVAKQCLRSLPREELYKLPGDFLDDLFSVEEGHSE
ncbi:MAG: V-type ATP synthase subunit B [Synergistales bacterium]|nr:V-type ATP synthase subunit B [Synergistales bacterium]